MAAYVIANIRVSDPEAMKKYSQLATPIVTQFGGRYLARGGTTSPLEGTPGFQRTVIIEFASLEAIHTWWNSPEYREAKAMRTAAAETDMIAVEGVL